MSRDFVVDHRNGTRYPVSLPVQAEWDDSRSGAHVIAEGATENIGPEGALVHLHQLPEVGSRVELNVIDEAAGTSRMRVMVEVLRLERNPVQPLAALLLVDHREEWRGLVWEPAALLVNMRDGEDELYDE